MLDSHAAALEAQQLSLDVRTAECVQLRHRIAELEGELRVGSARDEALRKSAARGAKLSEELLEARRQQNTLAARLAASESELRALRYG